MHAGYEIGVSMVIAPPQNPHVTLGVDVIISPPLRKFICFVFSLYRLQIAAGALQMMQRRQKRPDWLHTLCWAVVHDDPSPEDLMAVMQMAGNGQLLHAPPPKFMQQYVADDMYEY